MVRFCIASFLKLQSGNNKDVFTVAVKLFQCDSIFDLKSDSCTHWWLDVSLTDDDLVSQVISLYS